MIFVSSRWFFSMPWLVFHQSMLTSVNLIPLAWSSLTFLPARAGVEVEVPAVMVPHDLRLPFGRGEVEGIEGRGIRVRRVRGDRHVRLSPLRDVADDVGVEDAFAAESQSVLRATAAVDGQRRRFARGDAVLAFAAEQAGDLARELADEVFGLLRAPVRIGEQDVEPGEERRGDELGLVLGLEQVPIGLICGTQVATFTL